MRKKAAGEFRQAITDRKRQDRKWPHRKWFSEEWSFGECRGLMKIIILTEVVFELALFCAGLVLPSLWPVFFLLSGILCVGMTGAGFLLTDRRVERTMCQVDDTISGLMENRRTDYFSSNDDTLLGKFQSQIYRLHDILRSYEEKEKQLRTELNASLSNLVHQINTPITNLMVYSDFLMQEKLQEEERMKFALRIRQQAQKLSWLGEGFARLSRLETGMIILHPVRQQILPVLLRAMQQAEAKASDNGNELLFEGEDKLNVVLDAKWMEEAFYNILDNAIKYGKPGGRITVRVEAYELYARIDICNEGAPIPAEEYPLIFSRFGRGKGSGSKEGVGLGLYLAREVIKKQGGYIRAGYDRMKGTNIFSVFLRKE